MSLYSGYKMKLGRAYPLQSHKIKGQIVINKTSNKIKTSYKIKHTILLDCSDTDHIFFFSISPSPTSTALAICSLFDVIRHRLRWNWTVWYGLLFSFAHVWHSLLVFTTDNRRNEQKASCRMTGKYVRQCHMHKGPYSLTS